MNYAYDQLFYLRFREEFQGNMVNLICQANTSNLKLNMSSKRYI